MIHVLTGPVHSGKTTFLRGMSCALKELGVNVKGFLSIAVRGKGITVGYDLFDLTRGKITPFLRNEGEEEWQRTGPYYLLPEGLAEAKRLILAGREADLLIVDEVGPLELHDQGIWPALKQILDTPNVKCLLVVREKILKDFLTKVGDCKKDVCHLKDGEILSRVIPRRAPPDKKNRD